MDVVPPATALDRRDRHFSIGKSTTHVFERWYAEAKLGRPRCRWLVRTGLIERESNAIR